MAPSFLSQMLRKTSGIITRTVELCHRSAVSNIREIGGCDIVQVCSYRPLDGSRRRPGNLHGLLYILTLRICSAA